MIFDESANANTDVPFALSHHTLHHNTILTHPHIHPLHALIIEDTHHPAKWSKNIKCVALSSLYTVKRGPSAESMKMVGSSTQFNWKKCGLLRWRAVLWYIIPTKPFDDHVIHVNKKFSFQEQIPDTKLLANFRDHNGNLNMFKMQSNAIDLQKIIQLINYSLPKVQCRIK